MTQQEAETVVAWCEKNELIRPDVESRQGKYVLTWLTPFDSGKLITSIYDSARHWCRVMQIEHDHGVPGYWEK